MISQILFTFVFISYSLVLSCKKDSGLENVNKQLPTDILRTFKSEGVRLLFEPMNNWMPINCHLKGTNHLFL